MIFSIKIICQCLREEITVNIFSFSCTDSCGGQIMISPKSQLITKYQCTHLEPRLLQVARVFVLKKTDLDNLDKFDEETINTVNRNLYVDDCLKSVPTTDKVARLSGQFRELLSRGGFRLTKWISNDRNVITTVTVMERAPSVVNLDLDDLHVERTLSSRLSFCQPRASCRAYACKSMVGTKRFLMKISSYGKDG